MTCAPPPGDAVVQNAPVVLFEVGSPSSASIDHGAKVAEYRSLPSLRRYVILEQDEVAVTVHVRTADGWRVEAIGPGEVLTLPEVGIAVPVDALYAGVFPPA